MRIILALAAASALAGCATGPAEPVAGTETVTETATEAEAVTMTETVTATAPETVTATFTPSPADSAPAPLPYDGQPGEQTTIRGEAATVCINGDGFALNAVAAGPHTSCEFAIATLNQLTQHLDPTHGNVRERLPASVTALSPVTGQHHAMFCRQEDFVLITCTGGQDAKIWMY